MHFDTEVALIGTPWVSIGAMLGSIWGPVDPFWYHCGVLEAPVEALWELVEPHCLHGRVWVRCYVNFEAGLGAQMKPKKFKK